MNDMKVHDDLERDIANIAEKLAPAGLHRPNTVRPRFMPGPFLASDPAPTGDPSPPIHEQANVPRAPTQADFVAAARLTVRARIMESVVTQSIAAHDGLIKFTPDDMQRMEEAERQVFGIGL